MILDLRTNLSSSGNIDYKHYKFPDGQQDIVIISDLGDTDKIKIISTLSNFLELEKLICATKALRRLGVKKIDLFCTYLLGGRSDRQFERGGTSYLVDVIAPIINGLNFNLVQLVEPHNEAMTLATIKNSISIPGYTFIADYLLKHPDLLSKIILVSPDAGALKKTESLAEIINYNNDIVVAVKQRQNGQITKTKVFIDQQSNEDKIALIVDDLCDGGATFSFLHKSLSEYKFEQIWLYVTHGLFTKGIDPLINFDKIIKTDSYKKTEHNLVTNISVWN